MGGRWREKSTACESAARENVNAQKAGEKTRENVRQDGLRGRRGRR